MGAGFKVGARGGIWKVVMVFLRHLSYNFHGDSEEKHNYLKLVYRLRFDTATAT
jgi:hypothetical protein